jgi:Arc-like DNA binding dprotein
MPERVHLQVRLPKALRDWLAEQAARNDRSLNAEIVWQLEYNRVVKMDVSKEVKIVADPRLSDLKHWMGDDFIKTLAHLVAQELKR